MPELTPDKVVARIEDEREHLARNGSLCLCWGSKWVIAYRRQGQKRMIYVGSNPACIAAAKELLERLQAPAKEKRALRKAGRAHGYFRRRIRSVLRNVIKTKFNLRLHGCEIRRLA